MKDKNDFCYRVVTEVKGRYTRSQFAKMYVVVCTFGGDHSPKYVIHQNV